MPNIIRISGNQNCFSYKKKNQPALDIKMDKLWSLMRATAAAKTDSVAKVRPPWTNAN